MERTGKTSGCYLLFFFLSYYFFINRIVCRQVVSQYGNLGLYLILMANLLLPFLLFLEKPLNYVKRASLTLISQKSYGMSLLFIVKVLISIYFIFTSILSLHLTTSFVISYYFRLFPLYIFILLFLLVVYYGYKKGIRTLNITSVIIFIYLIIHTLIYIASGGKWHLFTLVKVKTDLISIIEIIVFLSFYFFEFVLLFFVSDEFTTKISKKMLFLSCLLFSLVTSYEMLRQVSEFGVLLKDVAFTYYESWKLVVIPKIGENISYFTLFYSVFLCFSRLTFCFYIFNKLWSNNSKLVHLGYMGLIFIGTYILGNYYEIYDQIGIRILISSLIIIALCSILVTIILIRGRRVEYERLSKDYPELLSKQ